MFKTLTKYQMDRWVPWPSLDTKVLLSFVLQGLFVQSSLCTRLGLHWTQLFGLMRVSCASRVLHFVSCAENNSLLRQKLDSERQLTLRIGKLLVQLAFITHVCACLYCAIARLEIGYDAENFPPSSFFPDVEILYGPDRNVFTCYSRAVHWAFVSLSGIGNCESVPSSSLECWFTLIVHMIGAVFYAIVTGLVISTLEAAAEKDNKTGSDIAKLSKYLTTARMSQPAKERIMKGYMMRNVLTESDAIDASRIETLDNDDEILGTLPNYLKIEVAIYARAEMIHRREKLFLHCSNVFLVALSSVLPRTRTLISGDYLMKENEPFVRDFYVIEKGTLQIQQRNHTIKTLGRGNCIGKAWLLQLKNESKSNLDFSDYTDWLLPDGTAACSIRAVGPCVLTTGLSSTMDIQALENTYPVDFQLLRAEVRGQYSTESERKAKAIRGIAKAVRRFKARRRRAEAAALKEE